MAERYKKQQCERLISTCLVPKLNSKRSQDKTRGPSKCIDSESNEDSPWSVKGARRWQKYEPIQARSTSCKDSVAASDQSEFTNLTLQNQRIIWSDSISKKSILCQECMLCINARKSLITQQLLNRLVWDYTWANYVEASKKYRIFEHQNKFQKFRIWDNFEIKLSIQIHWQQHFLVIE